MSVELREIFRQHTKADRLPKDFSGFSDSFQRGQTERYGGGRGGISDLAGTEIYWWAWSCEE